MRTPNYSINPNGNWRQFTGDYQVGCDLIGTISVDGTPGALGKTSTDNYVQINALHCKMLNRDKVIAELQRTAGPQRQV